MPQPDPSPAQEVFAAFLERLESGETCDFQELCRDHPDQSDALARMHQHWTAMQQAFELVGQDAVANAHAAASIGGHDPLMALLDDARPRLDRYVLGDEIARGGMGRIVSAFDNELRREVALKLLRVAADDPRRRRRFLEEAQIAAQLEHPGIAAVHELGLDAAGVPFFSMQLVRGQHLGEVLQRSVDGDSEWSRPRVLSVLLRVCEAMAFAHERGVVHRDLKPQNIMVGYFGETYVMDWGLARVRGSELDTVRADIEQDSDSKELLTHDGDVVGTPTYMAPEQASDSVNAEPAADVYAVGAILYHLLAGRAPYLPQEALGADSVLRQLRAHAPPPLPTTSPVELRAICERAMARRPQDRYANMTELAADLRAFLEVRTVRAYATGPIAELSKWVSRNRSLAMAALAFVAALAIAAIGITLLWREAVESQQQADTISTELRVELDRSAFRNARQSLQLQNSREAGDTLWRMHLAGTLPRASQWALLELAQRDPFLVTVPLAEDLRPVAFDPDRHAVLVGGSDGYLQVRTEATLAIERVVGQPGPAIMSLVMLPGTSIAICGTSRGHIQVIDLASNQIIREVNAHRGSVRYVVAGKNGDFASGGADGVVLWWTDTQTAPRTLLQLEHGVTSLTMRPGCDGLAAGDEQGNIAARALDGSWQFRYRTGARVTALAFGATPNELWAGGTDHQLYRFDFVAKQRNLVQPTRNGTCRQLARDQDGELLVGGWWRIDRIAPDGSAMAPAALRGVSRWAIDTNSRRLCASGAVSGLGILDLSQRDQRPLPGASAIALSGDGARYAIVKDGRATVFDVQSNAELQRMPRGMLGRLTLDQHGAALAIHGNSPNRTTLFDVETGNRLASYPGPADDPLGGCVAFAPGQQEAAFVVGSERIQRRASDGSTLTELSFPGNVIRIRYDTTGKFLAAIARTGNVVRLYDLEHASHVDYDFVETLPNGKPASLCALALSPDLKRIAVGTWQGVVMVRDLNPQSAPTEEPHTTTLVAHAGTIWSLEFDPTDSGLLISSGGSQGIACWDLDSGECCYQAVHDVAQQMQISSDARTLACLVPDGGLLLDLSYRLHHIAGTLEHHVARLRDQVLMPQNREADLRHWAAAVIDESWPRWR